jgi:hypothetical protein
MPYPAEDPAGRRGVEEGHGCVQDAVEDLLEELVRGLEADDGHEEGARRDEHHRDGGDDGVHVDEQGRPERGGVLLGGLVGEPVVAGHQRALPRDGDRHHHERAPPAPRLRHVLLVHGEAHVPALALLLLDQPRRRLLGLGRHDGGRRGRFDVLVRRLPGEGKLALARRRRALHELHGAVVGGHQRREVGAGLEELVVLAGLHDHAVLHHLEGCAVVDSIQRCPNVTGIN